MNLKTILSKLPKCTPSYLTDWLSKRQPVGRQANRTTANTAASICCVDTAQVLRLNQMLYALCLS